MRERFVVLGLAPTRADWFATVGHWATAAALPIEFLRCVSVGEVRARLESGRAFSALLVDAATSGLDRDLLATARDAGCAVLVVDQTPDTARDWRDLGADAVLAAVFSRDELLEVFSAHATPVPDVTPRVRPEGLADGPARRGWLVAVTGPGGTGASTAAIALAQGLAAMPATGPDVLLADLCRRADQAMLHDSRVLVPSVQEVVEAYRTGRPGTAALREQTFEVAERGYRLLLGLRHHRNWTALRPRAVGAALDGLLALADVVVADLEAELEGEAETGSLDIEDRHVMARAAIERADVVVVVGAIGMSGIFGLVRTISDLVAFGVPADRILPVLNRSPRNPRARAELQSALVGLFRPAIQESADVLAPPVHLPVRRVDAALRDGAPIPAPLPALLAAAVSAVRDRAGEPEPTDVEPVRVEPGTLAGAGGEEAWS